MAKNRTSEAELKEIIAHALAARGLPTMPDDILIRPTGKDGGWNVGLLRHGHAWDLRRITTLDDVGHQLQEAYCLDEVAG